MTLTLTDGRAIYDNALQDAVRLWGHDDLFFGVDFSIITFPVIDEDSCAWARWGDYDFAPDAPCRAIEMNQTWYPFLDEREVDLICRHELAHVMAGRYANHGDDWQRLSVELGSLPYEFTIPKRFAEIPFVTFPQAVVEATLKSTPFWY